MNNAQERLSLIIEEVCEGNIKAYAELTGINIQTLYRYLRDRKPNFEALIDIRIKSGVNLNWFVTGEGEMFGHKEQGRVHAPEISPEILAEVLECFQEEFFPKSEMSPEIMADLIIRAYKKIVELIASRPEQKDDLRCDLTNTVEKVT